MAINILKFKDINAHHFDVIVVGAGFAGSVMARELAERAKKKVLLLEKRTHIGGNMDDCENEAGILVHKYGPHIFHTNYKRAYDYLCRFTEFTDYQHKVLANLNGKYVPVPFNKNSIEACFEPKKAIRLIKKLVNTFGDEKKVPINDLRMEEDPDLSELAHYIYNNVFEYYTRKQWNLKPEELDPSVTARVPVFISRDNRYFQDKFQGMPADGYTKLFKNM
ncbi:MAG: FAD-dependent oxidoreductase, partial [Eggerthellaceae bacterium]|nr:FAD-dependent oxidoreductase [Eggerthellaceae bacterium]